MTEQLDVVVSELSKASARLKDAGQRLQDGLSGVDLETGQLLGSGWKGDAATAFGSAWDRWHSGAGQVVRGLQSMSDLLSVAAKEYAKTDEQGAGAIGSSTGGSSTGGGGSGGGGGAAGTDAGRSPGAASAPTSGGSPAGGDSPGAAAGGADQLAQMLPSLAQQMMQSMGQLTQPLTQAAQQATQLATELAQNIAQGQSGTEPASGDTPNAEPSDTHPASKPPVAEGLADDPATSRAQTRPID